MSDVTSGKRPLNIGTHQTHCCKRHGCKYGNEDCPVEDGTVEQEYSCEQCQSSALIKRRIKALEEEMQWSESLETRGVKIYDDLDCDYYDFD